VWRTCFVTTRSVTLVDGDAAVPCGSPLMMAWSPKVSPRRSTLTMDLGLQGDNVYRRHASTKQCRHGVCEGAAYLRRVCVARFCCVPPTGDVGDDGLFDRGKAGNLKVCVLRGWGRRA
jgi:hypothetical protein